MVVEGGVWTNARTEKKGLSKNRNKELIVQHLKDYGKGFAKDIEQVLVNVERPTVNKYLKELRKEGKIRLVGNPHISKGEDRAYYELV